MGGREREREFWIDLSVCCLGVHVCVSGSVCLYVQCVCVSVHVLLNAFPMLCFIALSSSQHQRFWRADLIALQ